MGVYLFYSHADSVTPLWLLINIIEAEINSSCLNLWLFSWPMLLILCHSCDVTVRCLFVCMVRTMSSLNAHSRCGLTKTGFPLSDTLTAVHPHLTSTQPAPFATSWTPTWRFTQRAKYFIWGNISVKCPCFHQTFNVNAGIFLLKPCLLVFQVLRSIKIHLFFVKWLQHGAVRICTPDPSSLPAQLKSLHKKKALYLSHYFAGGGWFTLPIGSKHTHTHTHTSAQASRWMTEIFSACDLQISI